MLLPFCLGVVLRSALLGVSTTVNLATGALRISGPGFTHSGTVRDATMDDDTLQFLTRLAIHVREVNVTDSGASVLVELPFLGRRTMTFAP